MTAGSPPPLHPLGEFLRQLRIAGLSPAPGGIYHDLANNPRLRQAVRAFATAIREDERHQATQDKPAQPEHHEINNTAAVTQIRPNHDSTLRTQRPIAFGFAPPDA